MKNRPIKYNQPISTAAWLQTRLPYGSRVRRILGEMVHDGTLHRVGYGIYRRVGQ